MELLQLFGHNDMYAIYNSAHEDQARVPQRGEGRERGRDKDRLFEIRPPSSKIRSRVV